MSRGELVGIGFAFSGDADPMIGKVGVHFGDENFRHVTRGAVLRCGRTSGTGMVGGGFCAANIDVAAQTDMVVRRGVSLERQVRVVTSDAGQAGVGLRPTFAGFEAIRLRTGVGYAANFGKLDVPEGAMARAAEIHGIGGL